MKKLTIADVKVFEISSKKERKMVIGGEEPGSQCQFLMSGRCYDGQCYCDWRSNTTGEISCDIKCPMANCRVLLIDC